MADIKEGFVDLVGNTPLIRLNKIKEKNDLKADLLAKLEYFNPAGSVKDRIAKEMILDALERGSINSETTLIEPTKDRYWFISSSDFTQESFKDKYNVKAGLD